MSEKNYLKSARTAGAISSSDLSEPELISTREEFAEAFNDMSDIRAKINAEKVAACIAIDEKYKEELAEQEAAYSMLLSLIS
jgi:hypothetical protein